jgi:hypothetical protein
MTCQVSPCSAQAALSVQVAEAAILRRLQGEVQTNVGGQLSALHMHASQNSTACVCLVTHVLAYSVRYVGNVHLQLLGQRGQTDLGCWLTTVRQ